MSFSPLVLVSQESVGNVDVKTKIVHFYVQRKTPFRYKDVIPFESARLNEGGAMDVEKGIFTAPVAGIYHFEFAYTKDCETELSDIFLHLNGEIVAHGHINSKQPTTWDWRGVTMIASLRLKSKDRVNLFNDQGTVHENDKHLTHFVGWLVEEDLT